MVSNDWLKFKHTFESKARTIFGISTGRFVALEDCYCIGTGLRCALVGLRLSRKCLPSPGMSASTIQA